ncbi:MAG: MBL fold metallo-hydrolase [Candidatus Obscuribacter sp.]|nr:MBL fold metallo-hydrolase [Candidatus Obscuribacter sp.]MBP6593331.1 MBL fold metallo-hydrolase [Candidatus Obscuribacter sp.]
MSVDIEFFEAGSCKHPEAVVMQGGSWKNIEFPAGCALIKHGQYGAILFDTGYSSRFFAETQKFPFNIYAALTPVALKGADELACALSHSALSAAEIKTIIVSHFHADHVGGLGDFAASNFVCAREALAAIKGKSGFAALKRGFLAGLIPSDFEQRLTYMDQLAQVDLPESFYPFKSAFDLTLDQRVLLVELPGHAAGHIGVIVRTTSNGDYFLIGDACWVSDTFKELRMPHMITGLVNSDSRQYRATIDKLHQLHQNNPSLMIVPSHCKAALLQATKQSGQAKGIYEY